MKCATARTRTGWEFSLQALDRNLDVPISNTQLRDFLREQKVDLSEFIRRTVLDLTTAMTLAEDLTQGTNL